MKEISQPGRLEDELGVDLAEASRLVQMGRRDALAKLEPDRHKLGDPQAIASSEIERYASDVEEDLKLVRARLGELHLLLSKEELRNLEILDHFRDRVVEAMKFADGDIEALLQRGEVWSSTEAEVSEAWSQLARRLSLIRMQLVREAETVGRELGGRAPRLDDRHGQWRAVGVGVRRGLSVDSICKSNLR